MDRLTQEDIDAVELTEEDMNEIKGVALVSDEELEQIKESLEQPVERQKELAAKIKIFIDHKMTKEMKEGFLSDSTRRWVLMYNNILEHIQKARFGDKSVNLHLHKISHSDIMEKVNEYSGNKNKK